MAQAAKTWGPARKKAALTITFDNLGEAADISLGLAPRDGNYGGHYTATDVVPRLLDLLGPTRATYFIEGINATIYPDSLRSVAAAGHEIGLHAWQHEGWGSLRASTQKELVGRGLEAMAALDIRPVGFRPPGGSSSPDALDVLRDYGFLYCSPFASHASRAQDGMVLLPFQWRYVDAYHMDPVLGFYRAVHGMPERPIEPDAWAKILDHGLADARSRGEHFTVIFHPYLFGKSAEQWAVLGAFLDKVKASDDIWMAPGAEVAGWIKDHHTAGTTSASPF